MENNSNPDKNEMSFILCNIIKNMFRKKDLPKSDYRTSEDKAFTISDEN